MLQEVGNEADGLACLNYEFRDCTVIFNCSEVNKNRSVGLIISKKLQCKGVALKNQLGNLLGMKIICGDADILVVSAYLPPNLDVPLSDTGNLSDVQTTQFLAQETYGTLDEK